MNTRVLKKGLALPPLLLLLAGLFLPLCGLPALAAADAFTEAGSWEQLAQLVAEQPEDTAQTYTPSRGMLAGGDTILIENRTVILSGGSIARAEGHTGLLFMVGPGGSLILDGGFILMGAGVEGAEELVLVSGPGARLTIRGASVTGSAARAGAAAIAAEDGGYIGIDGGRVYGNTGHGAVRLSGAGTIGAMSGGEVSNNKLGSGAAVAVLDEASFTLTGGSISANTGPCGGVYNGGFFTLAGGEIAGNTALENGGGICNEGSLTLRAGAVTGNSAVLGAGVYNTAGGFVFFEGGRVGWSYQDNTIFSLAGASAHVIAANLADTAAYYFSGVDAEEPAPGAALAVKSAGGGLLELTDVEAGMFFAASAQGGQPCVAAGGQVTVPVEAMAAGGASAPAAPAAPVPEPAPEAGGGPPRPAMLALWLALALLSLGGAAAMVVLLAKTKRPAQKAAPKTGAGAGKRHDT